MSILDSICCGRAIASRRCLPPLTAAIAILHLYSAQGARSALGADVGHPAVRAIPRDTRLCHLIVTAVAMGEHPENWGG